MRRWRLRAISRQQKTIKKIKGKQLKTSYFIKSTTVFQSEQFHFFFLNISILFSRCFTPPFTDISPFFSRCFTAPFIDISPSFLDVSLHFLKKYHILWNSYHIQTKLSNTLNGSKLYKINDLLLLLFLSSLFEDLWSFESIATSPGNF